MNATVVAAMRGWLVAAVLFTACPAPTVEAGEAVARRAFVTSYAYKGKLEAWSNTPPGLVGLEAADWVCQASAVFAGVSDPSAVRAWLSTSTTDAYCHVQGLTGKRGTGCQGGTPLPVGPLYLANGITPFAGTLDEIVGSRPRLYRPILLDESSNLVNEDDSYWTGTNADGTDSGSNCQDWTFDGIELGQTGAAIRTTGYWTDSNTTICTEWRRLLCIEAGASRIQPPSRSPGALMFVTSSTGTGDLGSWPDAGGANGIAAGDAVCRAHARRGKLPSPDSFFAWLSDDATNAGDRLTASEPYRRVDGFAIDNSASGLLDGSNLNSPHVDESGAYVRWPMQVWTGTDAHGMLYNPLLDCREWTSGQSEDSGLNGNTSGARDYWWTFNGWLNCNSQMALYCFSNTVVLFRDGFE